MKEENSRLNSLDHSMRGQEEKIGLTFKKGDNLEKWRIDRLPFFAAN